MEAAAIKAHWEDWARRYATDLRSTTKTPTIKRLEVDALERAIHRHRGSHPGRMLEVGCGQGLNLLYLLPRLPGWIAVGLDYVAEMVAAAETNRAAAEVSVGQRLSIVQGDALNLEATAAATGPFDVVFCDRMVINLGAWANQAAALNAMAQRVAPGGLLLVLENAVETHAEQNRLRELLHLPSRPVAEYNRFLPDAAVRDLLGQHGTVVQVEDFAALHDLLLYVLIPATNGGTVDYAHPLVQATTDLLVGLQGQTEFPAIGQNRLWVMRR
jgi:SAM-dependent methyltransferase